MRSRTLSNVLTVVAAGSIVTASPALHKHHKHHQLNGRAPDNVKTVNVPGPTMVAYELNGNLIDEDEVCKGIKDGTLKWVEGTESPPECPVNEALSSSITLPVTTTATPTKHASSALAAEPTAEDKVASRSMTSEKVVLTTMIRSTSKIDTIQHLQTSSKAKQTQHPQSTPTPAFSRNADIQSASGSVQNGQGLEKDFPDGTIDCSTFPSGYGPIEVGWAGLGGWSGIQYVTIKGNSVTHIDTAVPGGQGCKAGAMCSYACPPGYQKSQWPSAQGTTGQSVGGLRCDANGKLTLTNSKLSKKLCIPGTGATVVENKLSNNAAICRTDYPGTENEVVPLNTNPETTSPLTCPDASTYFRHAGSSTTAQYYINNQGIPLQKACIWGSDGTNMGNWAPSFIGVGQDIYGKTFLAIASTADNKPTNYKPLNYTVEITGHLTGKCRLKDGKYCSGPTYNDCNARGCTVELLSGQATYVLSD